jgi:phenylacetate-CoA ligase
MTETWKGDIETAVPKEREARNLERLRAHLERVRERSPFYRDRLADVDPASVTSLEALAGLPSVTKLDIIEDQAGASPYGTLLGCAPDDVVRLYVGPGPQATYFTREDFAVACQDAAWTFFTNGFRPGDVVDVTIMYHWVIAGTLMDEGYRLVGCATIPGGIGMSQAHIENLRWTRATGLFAFPTFLEELAAKAGELGVDPASELDVRLCSIAGEQRGGDFKARMAELWGGMQVRELYGGAEVPFIAAECEAGGGMHLNPDLVVEVVNPESGEPVAAAEPGLIVASETVRAAYPMIRYSTGDLTEGLDPEPCRCGRTTPRLGRIVGRVGEVPRVKGLFVIPAQVRAALDGVDGLGRFQLVIERPQRQDELTVRVEHDGPAEARAGLAPAVVRALKDGIRLTCEVELVDGGTLGEDAPVVDDRRRL